MLRKDAVKLFGSQVNVARVLGLTRAAVSAWGEIVPEGQAYKLQVVTGGKIKVDPRKYRERIGEDRRA